MQKGSFANDRNFNLSSLALQIPDCSSAVTSILAKPDLLMCGDCSPQNGARRLTHLLGQEAALTTAAVAVVKICTFSMTRHPGLSTRWKWRETFYTRSYITWHIK